LPTLKNPFRSNAACGGNPARGERKLLPSWTCMQEQEERSMQLPLLAPPRTRTENYYSIHQKMKTNNLLGSPY